MADRARHLQLLDEHGEIHDLSDCPGCAERDRAYHELERKYRGALTQIGNMRADRAAEANQHKAHPEIAGLFLRWRDECNHPRSPYTPERFWQALPRLQEYGADFIRLAIQGAATDPYLGEPRKNGSIPRYDDWELIMRSPEKIEDFARRAPLEMIRASTWEIVNGNWQLKN